MSELAFERYIFAIGIYIENPNDFYTWRNTKIEEHLLPLGTEVEHRANKGLYELYVKSQQHFITKYGGWRYNQAVGWLRLYILGTQLRGETWFVEAKRISRTMKEKKFSDFEKAFELDFLSKDISSMDIYKQLLDELEELKKEDLYKGRYLDLEALHNTGPFVNWRQLIGLE